jgi:hypothetical protein
MEHYLFWPINFNIKNFIVIIKYLDPFATLWVNKVALFASMMKLIYAAEKTKDLLIGKQTPITKEVASMLTLASQV